VAAAAAAAAAAVELTAFPLTAVVVDLNSASCVFRWARRLQERANFLWQISQLYGLSPEIREIKCFYHFYSSLIYLDKVLKEALKTLKAPHLTLRVSEASAKWRFSPYPPAASV